MSQQQSLTVWTNHGFDAAHIELLRQRLAPHRLVVAEGGSKSNLAAGGRDKGAMDADVAYGQPHIDDVLESDRLRYVQLSTAGYTRFDKREILDAIRDKAIALCNASSVYDE